MNRLVQVQVVRHSVTVDINTDFTDSAHMLAFQKQEVRTTDNIRLLHPRSRSSIFVAIESP